MASLGMLQTLKSTTSALDRMTKIEMLGGPLIVIACAFAIWRIYWALFIRPKPRKLMRPER